MSHATPAASVPIRVALRFAYDGTAFDSYARNPGTASVEAALIGALGREGLVEGSFASGSRTDAGVSARENVAVAALKRPHLRGLVPALQARLPAGVWATGAAVVDADWTPRRATSRTYRLLVLSGGEDLMAMRRAAKEFVGTHDVRAFAKLEAGREPTRTVYAVSVAASGACWAFVVRGQAFLWNQVRRTAGAILAVGRGEATVEDVRAALASGKPHARFGLAPAEGLVLERVMYRGLKWDPAAGTARRPDAEYLAARSRLAVVDHVSRLAGGERHQRP